MHSARPKAHVHGAASAAQLYVAVLHFTSRRSLLRHLGFRDSGARQAAYCLRLRIPAMSRPLKPNPPATRAHALALRVDHGQHQKLKGPGFLLGLSSQLNPNPAVAIPPQCPAR